MISAGAIDLGSMEMSISSSEVIDQWINEKISTIGMSVWISNV